MLGGPGLRKGPFLLPYLLSLTQERQVDGDLLLRLTDEELKTDLGMKSSVTRKRYGASCLPVPRRV